MQAILSYFVKNPLKNVSSLKMIRKGHVFLSQKPLFDSNFAVTKSGDFQVRVVVLLYWSWVPKMLCRWWLLQPPTRTVTSKLETGNVAVGKNLKVPKVYAIIQSWDHGHRPEQLPCLAVPEVTSWQWLAIYGVIPVVF